MNNRIELGQNVVSKEICFLLRVLQAILERDGVGLGYENSWERAQSFCLNRTSPQIGFPCMKGRLWTKVVKSSPQIF